MRSNFELDHQHPRSPAERKWFYLSIGASPIELSPPSHSPSFSNTALPPPDNFHSVKPICTGRDRNVLKIRGSRLNGGRVANNETAAPSWMQFAGYYRTSAWSSVVCWYRNPRGRKMPAGHQESFHRSEIAVMLLQRIISDLWAHLWMSFGAFPRLKSSLISDYSRMFEPA